MRSRTGWLLGCVVVVCLAAVFPVVATSTSHVVVHSDTTTLGEAGAKPSVGSNTATAANATTTESTDTATNGTADGETTTTTGVTSNTTASVTATPATNTTEDSTATTNTTAVETPTATMTRDSTPTDTRTPTEVTTTVVSEWGGLVTGLAYAALYAVVGLVLIGGVVLVVAAVVASLVVWLAGPFSTWVTILLPPLVGTGLQLFWVLAFGWLAVVPLIVQLPILFGVGLLLDQVTG